MKHAFKMSTIQGFCNRLHLSTQRMCVQTRYFSNTVVRELIVLRMDNKVFNFTDGFLQNLQNVY